MNNKTYIKAVTAIDVFCGAGGLTEGLKQAGFTVIGAIEKDEVVADVYRLNHPEVFLWNKDIRKITCKEIKKALGIKKGDLDLLAGCPPCQGFSSMRTKNGAYLIDDERNDLVFDMIEIVKDLMPKNVMIENVPGLAYNPRIKKILSILKSLGYYIDDETVQIHDISKFGVPQRRKRMVLITGFNKKIHFAQPEKTTGTVRQTLQNVPSPGTGNDPLHDYNVKRSERIEKLISLIPKNGGSRSDLPKKYWLPCHLRYPKGFKDVYGRMKWETVAPTITGGCINPSKGRFLHPEENRAITLREALLLQTFPKDYKFPPNIARDRIALMIGNALPPYYIKKHAEGIISGLLTKASR